MRRAREVLLERAPVEPRLPVAGTEDDARDRGLALAGAEVLRDVCHLALVLQGKWFRRLGLVRMLGPGVDLELRQLGAREAVAGKHPLDRLAQHLRGAPAELLAQRPLTEPT